ncbi:odorant receptor 45a-like [Musca vetustissima]|uniref:odorant receptor 45a-like n=1 Tax=Musca vetustissima TaxID=27455 RepID=UPI002AB6FE94|nr:odorant receptor 45a-like [Musca vetustissima]
MITDSSEVLPKLEGIKYYFNVQKFCFTAIGVDLFSTRRTIFNGFLFWIPNIVQFILSEPLTLYSIQNLEDMNLVTDAMAPVWQVLMANMKMVLFLWHRRDIKKLVRELWEWNLEATKEELKMIEEENRKDTLTSGSFYMTVFSTGVLALVAPFFKAFYGYLKGEDFWEVLETPLKGSYFMDPKETYLGYFIAYMWALIAIYAVINTTLAVDSLFSWIVHNIAAHFWILRERLKSIAESNIEGIHCYETLRKSIGESVRYHQRIIDIIEEFNEVFMMIVFVKFLISCIQIAFLAFQFVRGGELAGQVFHTFFLMSISMQMMLYCYGGQRIKDESASIAVTIYEHFHWEVLCPKSRKLLLLPLARAQKSSKLTGVFFITDLSLFLWVYKTAGSFMTLMMSVSDGENK